MKGLTRDVPKPMLRIGGKPILEHKINALPKKIKEVVIIIGYRGEQIMSYFKRYFAGRKIVYVYQHEYSGTGGTLHLAKSVLRDKFLVMMGDDLYHKKDLEELIRYDLALLACEVDNPCLFGIVKTDKRGEMVDVVEKPKRTPFRLAATGAYVLNRKFFDYDLVPIGGGEFGLPQTMAKMAGDYGIKVTKARAWHPIGNPEDLKSAEENLHMFL